MSKGNTFETELLEAILNGVAIANLLDNAATSPLATLYVAGHTADPGEAGTQSTNEASYTGYARGTIARNPSSKKWDVVSGSASNNVAVPLGACTAGSPQTLTHFSIGVASSGASKILYKGAVTSPGSGLVVNPGITPNFAPGALVVTED